MPLLALSALRAHLTKDQRLIGIDPGSKTVGLALSDVRLMLASPFGSLKRGKLKANAAEILAIAQRENAGGLVIGLPLSMDGSSGSGRPGRTGLGFGAVGGNGVAGRGVRRTTVQCGGQPVSGFRGRRQPEETCGGG